MRVACLNLTSRNRRQAARSSTCCGRPMISTGPFSRLRRSSSPASVQASSGWEPIPRCAMPTAEAGSPTRTTPLRWSTRSSGRAIPDADSRLATDEAPSPRDRKLLKSITTEGSDAESKRRAVGRHHDDDLDLRESRRKIVWSRCERYRDQDWRHDAVQRTKLGLRRRGPNTGSLLQDDQRSGWSKWPQDRLHLL